MSSPICFSAPHWQVIDKDNRQLGDRFSNYAGAEMVQQNTCFLANVHCGTGRAMSIERQWASFSPVAFCCCWSCDAVRTK